MILPFPSSLPAFQRAFPDDAACRAHLLSLRSGETFRCPRCGHGKAWALRSRGLLTCASCRRQVSVTSGGALDHARLPLSLVFLATYLVATTPGLNAVTLARQLGIARHGTAWLLLSKLRRAMTTALTEPLSGMVEADEAWFGGPQDAEKRRKWGRSALLVLALAEARPKGRVRFVRISDNRASTLVRVISEHVAAGSTIRTDGWQAYESLARHGYAHDRRPRAPGWAKRGERATPYADEAISAAKRWLIATYNKPPRAHLPTYLAEFAFRREFRDPATAFETILRVLMSAPPTPRRRIAHAADLPAILVAPPRGRPQPEKMSGTKMKPAMSARKRARQPAHAIV